VPVDCRIQLNDSGVAEQPNTQKQALCDPHGSIPVRQTQSAIGQVAPNNNSLSKASVETYSGQGYRTEWKTAKRFQTSLSLANAVSEKWIEPNLNDVRLYDTTVENLNKHSVRNKNSSVALSSRPTPPSTAKTPPKLPISEIGCSWSGRVLEAKAPRFYEIEFP
jgi:hypothetical protein